MLLDYVSLPRVAIPDANTTLSHPDRGEAGCLYIFGVM